ncbi:alpha/beta hydrolase [Aquabacterium sp. A7-Y]|uniref:alpha/beta fold hydrolase n=1 Tax=Aquabacterium sp. A7-Y TaxID=1349605 RepID=UPI00223E3384|nr:alpha/beta fold hydrolase [Aquabacterium sp. A7-Y]MCW7540251.1 alpha/beta hydrolase [Aquabacterium sp. A7-Y]
MNRLVSSDGVAIAYQVFGNDRSRPPVVLQHGYILDAARNWVKPGIVQALVAAGRRVFAPDARGHGASDKPHDSERYGEARMADDLRELFDLIGEDRIDLAGYSMGASVALLTAARDHRVRRLVVGGVGAALIEATPHARLLAGKALAAGMLAPDARFIGNPGVAAFRAFADHYGADHKAMAAHARAVETAALPLQRIRAPTLVLAGRHDPLAARPQVVAAAIPGAQLTLVGGDHMSALRDHRFAASLVDFLAAA